MRYRSRMNAEKLVGMLRDVVAIPAGEDTLTQIERPSGPNVAPDRTARAAWIAGLSPINRAHVEYAAREAANAAVFGFQAQSARFAAAVIAATTGPQVSWLVFAIT